MKRSPMPPRRTPLVCRVGLRRGGPINPVSTKRRRDNAHRTRYVSAQRLAAAGRCARCRKADQPVFGHERLSRAQGGSILRPDCVLCNQCNTWCEDHPQVAAYTGWKISSKWPHAHQLTTTQAVDLFGDIVDFEILEVA